MIVLIMFASSAVFNLLFRPKDRVNVRTAEKPHQLPAIAVSVDQHPRECWKEIDALAMRALLASDIEAGLHFVQGLAQFGGGHLANYGIAIVAFNVALPVANEAIQEARAFRVARRRVRHPRCDHPLIARAVADGAVAIADKRSLLARAGTRGFLAAYDQISGKEVAVLDSFRSRRSGSGRLGGQGYRAWRRANVDDRNL
jgi:hypothetical protein